MTATPAEELEKSSREKLFQAMLDTAGKGLERSRGAGQFVQGAAAAVGTLYAAAMALVFVAKDNPMPVRGLVPTLFLALAVALAAFYTAFLTKTPEVASPDYGDETDPERKLFIRADWFVVWANNSARSRQGALQAAVVSLAFGVLFLPLPFISTKELPPILAPASLSVAATKSQDPSPTPTWPPPPSISADPAVVVVLYQAQLDAFQEAQNQAIAPEQADDSAVIIWSLVVGLSVVAVAGLGPRMSKTLRS